MAASTRRTRWWRVLQLFFHFGDQRTGYLFHVAKGVLLARYDVRGGQLSPSTVSIGTGLSGAFLRRMGHVYRRLN